MDQLRSLIQSALAQRLAQHLQAEVAPLTALPGLRDQGAGQRALGGLRLGTMLSRDLVDTLGLAREGIDYGGKALTGALAVPAAYALDRRENGPSDNPLAAFMQGVGGAMPNPLLVLALAGKFGLPSPYGPSDLANTQQAFEGDQGNIVSKLRAANEGLAQESPLATGIVNQLVNPLTYATGGGTAEARAAQQAGRISRGLGIDLGTVNSVLYPEGQVIGRVASSIIGPAARKVLGPELLGQLLQHRYNLPAPPIPGMTADRELMAAKPAEDRAAQLLAALHPEIGPALPPELGPTFPEKGNVKGPIGPTLPGLQDVPLPPEFGPAFPERGNVQGKIGPLLPPEQGPALPTPPQDIADLLGAARQTAQPNQLEQLLGAGRGLAERAVTPRRTIGQIEAAVPAVPGATSAAMPEPIALLRDLLRTGDNGRGMVYPPADPAFWTKRTGVAEDQIPTLLRQLQAEGSLAPDQQGGLINTLITGGERTPEVVPPVTDLGGGLELPDMPGHAGQTRAEAIGTLTPAEVGTLAQLAYRSDRALKYAMAAHPSPADLANAALDRITTNRTLLENLAANHPVLAGKLAYLPESGAGDILGVTPRLVEPDPAAALRSFMADSVVKRADGSPQVVYHGTNAAFDTFRASTDTSVDGARFGAGYYFSADPAAAAEYASGTGSRLEATPEGANIIPAYLRLTHPLEYSSDGELPATFSRPTPLHYNTPQEFTAEARTLGYDGVIGRDADGTIEYVAFDPHQIKSATGNRGTYDPMRPGMLDLAPQATPPGGNKGLLNWLTRPLTTGGPAVTRLGVAGSGGVIGAAAGGLAPAEDDEQRRIHALQGAAVGAGLGLGATTRAGQGILRALPVAREFGGELLGAANTAQRAAMDRPSQGIANLPALANIWRVQATSTVRNLIQDELTARLWSANAGVRQQMINDNWSSLVQLYNLGQRNGYDALPTQTTSLLDKWGLTGYEPRIGASFNTMNQTMIKDFSAIDLAKAEALFAGLNPAQGGIPVAGLAFGAVKGYTRAWQESLFSTLNEFTRLAARHAAFQDEFAPAMQVAAHDFVRRNGAAGVLDPAQGFSAADVGQALGQQAQDEWATTVQKVVKLSEQRALDIHGDFSQEVAGGGKTAAQRAGGLVNTIIPFSSWALKAYPRTAQMMLDHPGVSLAIMLLTLGQAGKAQREGRAGLVGGIPIDANTPLVGGIARKMLGDFPGQAYVNLLGSLTPVSTSALLSPDEPVSANAYQAVTSALDRAGFSVNPLIQAGAYAANKDYQRPAPLSRTAGLEMALPGPDVPSFALGGLNAARVAAGGSAQHTTAEDRKLAELFYLSTGHNIADPSNVSDPQRAALLASTLDPHSPIRQLAAQSTGQANVARNLVSLVSPASVQAAPQVEQQAEAASYATRHAPPAVYDPRTIRALMNSGNMAQYIEAVMRQRANTGTQGEVSPLLQLTSQSAGQDRAALYLQALGASSIFGSPLVGAPQSLIAQLLGQLPPAVEVSGPQGGQR